MTIQMLFVNKKRNRATFRIHLASILQVLVVLVVLISTVTVDAVSAHAASAHYELNDIQTPPIALNDTYSIDKDVELNVSAPGVLENDANGELGILTAVKVGDPTHGAVTLNSNGSFTYLSTIGYIGDDSFIYKANDENGDSNLAIVTIHARSDIFPPPLPSSFYGEIHIFDNAPMAGDKVKAFVPDLVDPIATTTIISSDSTLVYALDVSGDITGTLDKEGGVESETIIFKINDRIVATAAWHSGSNVLLNIHPPEALAGSSYSGLAGTAISFHGSANDWGLDATTYQWDWDHDGIYDQTGQNPSHIFADFGSYIVGLKATDSQGGVGVTTVMVTVNKIPVTVTVTCPVSQVYTGSAIEPCIASYSGADGLTGSLIPTYTNNTNVGTATASASYAGDANHENSSSSGTFEITQASATVTLSDMTQIYDGTPKSVAVATNPAGLNFSMTYDGSSTPPTEVGNYAVVATITDPNYTGGANGTFVIIAKHSISLVQGWNLVSFNVDPDNKAIATVLSNIAGNYNLVYVWDASGGHASSGNWMKYDPTGPSYQNSLKNLDETMGFWVYMTAADTLDVVGSTPTTTNIVLSDNAGGWNLVSYPSMIERLLPSALSDHGVGTNFTLVYAYHAEDIADPWKLFDRAATYSNDLKQLTPGWGYWIKVNADHTWSVKYLAD